MNRAEFIAQVQEAAAAFVNVNPAGAAAHAALESNFGASKLAINGLNYWGVKSTPAWAGGTITMLTSEYISGRWISQAATFRKYASVEDCLKDYSGILSRVYPATATTTGNMIDWLACLWLKPGPHWSTDPLIYPKVLNIAVQYGLLGAPAPTNGEVETLVLNHATWGDRWRVLTGGAAIPLDGPWRWRVGAGRAGDKLDVAPDR